MSQNQSIIKSLSSDPGAVAHYKQWANTLQPTVEEIDIGLSYSEFSNPQFPTVKNNNSEGITPEEYYAWVINKINTLPVDLGIQVAESLHKETGIKIPYLFTDYNAKTNSDVRKKVHAQNYIHQEKQDLIASGHAKESDSFAIAMILSINFYVNTHMNVSLFQDANTFGMIDSFNKTTNCQGSSIIFYGLLSMAGLEPRVQTVEWKNNNSISHTRLVVPLNNSTYAVDAALGIFGNLPADEIALETSASDFVANQYYNHIIEDSEMKVDEKKTLVESALKLAPYNFRVLVVAIEFYESEGNFDQSTKQGL